MTIWQEIEEIRIKRGMSLWEVCNIFDMQEHQYTKPKKPAPTIYQLIMFISSARHSLQNTQNICD